MILKTESLIIPYKYYSLLFLLALAFVSLEKINAQGVGIGRTAMPNTDLAFNSVLGNKIVFQGTGSSNHSGIGVQSGVLQLYVPNTAYSHIFLSNGNGKVIINNAGFLGIGTMSPAYRLDVKGGMKLRSSLPSNSAGIWMSNNTQTADPFFVGMNGDENLGFYFNQPPYGWGFNMSAPFGHLIVNGSTGEDGMILTSGGANAPTTWQWPAERNMFNLSDEFWDHGSYTLTDASPTADPSGLSKTQNYPSNSRVQVFFNIPVNSVACCSYTELNITVKVDGVPFRNYRYSLENATTNTFTGSAFTTLTAGSHNISIAVQKISGSNIQVAGDVNRKASMLLITTPE